MTEREKALDAEFTKLNLQEKSLAIYYAKMLYNYGIDITRHVATATALCAEEAQMRMHIEKEVTDRIYGRMKALKEEPRAKGHWESHKSCKHTCSVCGYHTFLLTHYCPNCGADMRGEQNEN